MPYFLLGIALVIGFYLIFRGMSRGNAVALGKIVFWIAIAVGGFFILFLMFTGKIAVALSILAPLALVALRWRNLFRMMRNFGGPSAGQISDIETAYLRMKLHHDTGRMTGTVLQGTYEGRLLEELGLEELIALFRECRVNDEQGAQILETYLDRMHGDSWREQSGGGGGRSRANAAMSVEEARQVLGVGPHATADDIREAHRKLMLKVHPDRGGSEEEAARVNQAKDILLGL